MMLNGGELDGSRILGPRSVQLMTMNHLPDGRELSACALGSWNDPVNDGIGFGLGFAMTIDLPRSRNAGSIGEYYWAGSASTTFWIDPNEELTVIFMTQFMPSDTFNVRDELKQLLYAGLVESPRSPSARDQRANQ